jgi:selenocysteine-specific elongation factor
MHVVGTAGHVDHGKSTLVRALTGIDPDRFEEEKRRGLTIDLGFAWTTLPSGREIGIVDVPGHERFIRNMLAGAGGVDVALFVVAADEGFMPQSAEHLQVLDFLRVSGGVVALTKSDLVGAETLDLVRDHVWSLLRGTCLHDAVIVPVSATTGGGLDELVTALDDLLGATSPSADRGRPRLFVDRSFTIAGAGTVVTGTLTGGSIRVGDTVTVLPDGATARVRSLQTHQRPVDVAVPGSRVAANLVGLERVDVQRGDAVVDGGGWRTTASFAARLETSPSNAHAFTERGAYELYVGSAELACRVKFLEERADALVTVTLDGSPAAGIRPGSGLLVQIFCDRPLPLVPVDRFVIRDVGRGTTVAGGCVLDVAVRGTIRRGDEDAIARLRSREGLTPLEVARRIVSERGSAHRDELVAEAGASGAEIDAASWDDVRTIDRVLVERTRLDELRAQAIGLVGEHHRTHPRDAGMPRDAVVRALGPHADGFVASWLDDGTFSTDGNALRLPTHGAGLTPDDRQAADHLLARLRAGGVSPPTLKDVGAALSLVKAMERAGELVLIADGIAYPSEVWEDIVSRVVGLIGDGGPATVSQLREALGTTRKYAVPLLEKLDATGITRRSGDVRELGPRGRDLATRA